MWVVTNDGSVTTEEGKIIFFSIQRFVNEICLGGHCFICGAAPHEYEFNEEHILPKWLLRRYDLFSETITLPNKKTIQYAQYKIPCCKECNSLMGELIEKPISEIVRGGANAINEFISKGNELVVFVWMGLIYLKTHLKDRALRFHLDMRKGDGRIADIYEWEFLHHLHCVVRSFYTNCTVQPQVIGSCLSIPVYAQASSSKFDYGDLFQTQTSLLRLGDIGLVVVFNDSGGAMSYFWQKLKKITGPVSELQLREIMVDLAYLNLHLKERPKFVTECDAPNEMCRIIAQRPQLQLKDMDRTVRAELLYQVFWNLLPNITLAGRTEQDLLDAIAAGNLSFLFSDDGDFISESYKQI